MPISYKAIAFIIISVVAVWFSRFSLRNIRSHGFYRFFAWEAILALILLNIDCWFCESFSAPQIASWFLLIASLVLVALGAHFLHTAGKPGEARNDPSLIGIEKTTQLVTVGIYCHIRHPIYSSLLFLTWGVFFKRFSLIGACLAIIPTLSLVLAAKMEEKENVRFFGSDYEAYMRRTRMFIPFLF